MASPYFEPKSIAPILQEGLRARMPYLSQPKGGVEAAIPALGQMGMAAITGSAQRDKRLSILAQQKEYATYLSKVDAGTATDEDHVVGRAAGLSLGLNPPDLLGKQLQRSQIAENEASAWAKRNPKPATVDKPQAPQGYRFTANGNLEAIPGGPAAGKLAAIDERETTAQNSAIEQAQSQITKVDQALKNVSGWSTGWGAALVGKLPGSQAKDLQGDLDTIKANLGFSTLAEMKRASPTGGALGAISESEMRLLTSARESLDREQSRPQLIRNLQAVKKHYTNWMNAVQKSRGAQGGKTPPAPIGAPPPPQESASNASDYVRSLNLGQPQ